jgi:hypothetical protein
MVTKLKKTEEKISARKKAGIVWSKSKEGLEYKRLAKIAKKNSRTWRSRWTRRRAVIALHTAIAEYPIVPVYVPQRVRK